jgi:hypothetical protein
MHVHARAEQAQMRLIRGSRRHARAPAGLVSALRARGRERGRRVGAHAKCPTTPSRLRAAYMMYARGRVRSPRVGYRTSLPRHALPRPRLPALPPPPRTRARTRRGRRRHAHGYRDRRAQGLAPRTAGRRPALARRARLHFRVRLGSALKTRRGALIALESRASAPGMPTLRSWELVAGSLARALGSAALAIGPRAVRNRSHALISRPLAHTAHKSGHLTVVLRGPRTHTLTRAAHARAHPALRLAGAQPRACAGRFACCTCRLRTVTRGRAGGRKGAWGEAGGVKGTAGDACFLAHLYFIHALFLSSARVACGHVVISGECIYACRCCSLIVCPGREVICSHFVKTVTQEDD